MPALRLLPWLLALPSFAASAEKVVIVRDDFGIPHAYANTAAAAAFGWGYAQAADRTDQLLKNLKHGENPAAQDPLSARVEAILEAYCAGVNAYLAENGRAAERVDASMAQAFSRTAFSQFPDSNDILIAPSRSRDASPIAILAPMGDWSDASRLYPMEFEIADGFAFAGAAPVGAPFPLLGHSATIAIAARGAGLAGERALDQVWAMITARNVEEAKRALAQGQLPAQKFLIADAEGSTYHSGSGVQNPPNGVLMSGGGAPQGAAMTRELIEGAHTFSLESAESLALSTDVYKAESWQVRIARAAPDSPFARMITGWNRRAETDSRGALAFYLFKAALGEDSSAVEPPASLSDDRLRAALRKAQDQLETEFPVDGGWGALFRIFREGARQSWPVGGGAVTEAGIATPRAIRFARPGTRMLAHGGLAMLEVVEFSKPVRSVIMTPFGENDSPESPHFDDQARELFSRSHAAPTWFGERKSLEKRVRERKELEYRPPL
jgi:acyl-homoserine lactone acylase PvdQ